MATFIITITSDQTAEVNKDGDSVFKPRNMVPVVSGDIITFQHPYNVDYDFIIDAAADDITAAGSPVTGTAAEIAASLATSIFTEEVSGGAVEGLTSDGSVITAAVQEFNIVVAGGDEPFFGIWNNDATPTTQADIYLGGGDTTLEITAYGSGTGVSGLASNVKFTSSGKLVMGSPVVIATAAIAEHADNAAAVAAGLAVGQIYRTGDALKIVHA